MVIQLRIYKLLQMYTLNGWILWYELCLKFVKYTLAGIYQQPGERWCSGHMNREAMVAVMEATQGPSGRAPTPQG